MKTHDTRDDGYTAEIHDALIERLMMGRSLLSICRDEDMPSHATILRWRKKYPDLDDAIPRARAEGSHVLAEQCLDIADNINLDPQDRRVRIDTRMRLIGKWNARHYGDKTLVGSDPDNPLPQAFVKIERVIVRAGNGEPPDTDG